jgi:hypothetical protein
MSDTRSYFLPPLAAKPRPVSVNPVRAGGSGYAIAMTSSMTCAPPADGPKQAGPKPRFVKLVAVGPTKD